MNKLNKLYNDGCDEEVKKSLLYSVLDGAFCSAMIGFGESFLSAFGAFLKSGNVQLGFLTSFPRILGFLLQIYSNKLLIFFKRRKVFVCIGVLLQALMYIPITLTFFYGKNKIYYLIFFVSIYWILGMIITPAWNSWMADLVKEEIRGRYFGKRNKITGIIYLVSFLTGGFILQQFSSKHLQYIGFVVIFSLALISRLISCIYLYKQYDPDYKINNNSDISFKEFLQEIKGTNYGIFVIYTALINFAVYISAPFLNPYMLYDLKLSYLDFTLVTASPLIIKFFTIKMWGKTLDLYGTKKIIDITGYLMPIIPLLWCFSGNFWYLIFIQLYAGFIWGGFELATFTLTLDITTPQKRVAYIAYLNVIVGFAIFLGLILGGIVVKNIKILDSSYFAVFILSFIFRYISSIIFIPKIKEVRKVENISYQNLFLEMFTNGKKYKKSSAIF